MCRRYRRADSLLSSDVRLTMVEVVQRVRRRVHAVLVLVLILPLLMSGVMAAAPVSSGVEGTVLDPDNKAVVGAAIVIRNEATSAIVTTATDGVGRFSSAGLPPGSYAVEVFVPGF